MKALLPFLNILLAVVGQSNSHSLYLNVRLGWETIDQKLFAKLVKLGLRDISPIALPSMQVLQLRKRTRHDFHFRILIFPNNKTGEICLLFQLTVKILPANFLCRNQLPKICGILFKKRINTNSFFA